MSAKSKFRRIQELFERGKILVVDSDLEPITLWLSKPSAFEHDEAIRDARAARARAMLAFDRDEDQAAVLASVLADMSEDDLVRVLTMDRDLEHLRRARDEVRADKAWSERLEALDRTDLDGASPEETEALIATQGEYEAAVLAAKGQLDQDLRGELLELGREELEKRYRASFRNMIGSQQFGEAMRQSEIFFALRDCQARAVEGEWDHTGCDHRVRLLEERREVLDLPEQVLTEAVEILNGFMSEEQAGNSDAPSASSGSSEPHAAPEGSTRSTPTGTSPQPASTSS